MDKLLALAARCEAAETSEQRELLIEAFDAAFPNCAARWNGEGEPRSWDQPEVDGWYRFLKMLDAEAYESAAMSLVPEGWGWSLEVERPTVAPMASVSPPGCEPWGPGASESTDAATPALALCSASLRARHAEGTRDV